jgi:hypothetical protein
MASGFNLAIKLLAEPLRTIAFGSISGTYAGIGTALANPARQFLIQNTTDVLLTYSFDGVNDHFVLPSSSFFLNDISSNKALPSGAFYLAEGTRLYVKGSPTLGATYFSVFYGYNQ